MMESNNDDPSILPPEEIEDDFPILELLLRNYLEEEDILRVREAYTFAFNAHRGQVRENGTPYITHPISVAEILGEYQLDAETLMAGLLHDVLEDSTYTYEDLAQQFGKSVADMVQGVTKVGGIGVAYRSEEEVENLRRMLVATAQDLHVIVIKLADRLHNMRTLQFLHRDKQIRIAKNTLDIFAPLAHRLGLGRIKSELEDLCLMFLLPDVYQDLKKKVAMKRQEREGYVLLAIQELDKAIDAKGFHPIIEGRAKNFYSIYRKMMRDHKTFEEIYDLLALRVICESIGECYAILGEVHTLWRQMEGRFKDYISNPKPNNYRSIHTTVLGPYGRLIEIQIRTQEMHFIAEHGIAAHWRYKEDGKRKYSKDAKWIEPFSLEILDTRDPDEFLQTMRSDFFSDEVYVYSPKGELVRLPKDSTPVDFAYKIHTQLGNRCGGAKINGRIVPLTYPLQTGDVVEILSNPNSHPSPTWLDSVKTTGARNKIRRYLLESRRDELFQMGQANLTRELQKSGFNPLEFYKSEKAQTVAEGLRVKNIQELFVNIGFGRISTKQVIARLLQQKTKPISMPKGEELRDALSPDGKSGNQSVVRMGDIDDILYHRAQCCFPLPGDDIIGFVTRGRGVSIHKASCRNIHQFQREPGRIISLFWECAEEEHISVNIEIKARDRRNLLVDVSQMISSTGTNIVGCQSLTTNGVAHFVYTLDIVNINHLNTVIQQLLGVEGVKTVRRIHRPNHNGAKESARSSRKRRK